MTNPGADDLDYTVALSVSNPARAGSVNRARRDGAAQLLTLAASGIACDHPSAGDLTVATDSPVSATRSAGSAACGSTT